MNTEITKPVKRKLKTHEHVISGIPFLLVIVGGAIGGGVGGGAYAINASLFRKEMPNAKKYLYTTLVTIGAFVAYFGIIFGLALAFPGLFQNK